MPKPTRYAGVKMNFDAMTDTITNVAGAMIRLVILVLVITQPIASNLPPPPPPPNDLGDSSPAGKADQPLRPLVAEIELLKTLIHDVDGKTAAMERELPSLRDRVEKLRQAARSKSGTIETRADPSPPTPASLDGDRQVALAPQAPREQTP